MRCKFVIILYLIYYSVNSQSLQGVYVGFDTKLLHSHHYQKQHYYNSIRQIKSKSVNSDYLFSISAIKKNILNFSTGLRVSNIYEQKDNNQSAFNTPTKQSSFLLNTNYSHNLLDDNKQTKIYWGYGLTVNFLYKDNNRYYHIFNVPIYYELTTSLNYYKRINKSLLGIGIYAYFNPYANYGLLECGTYTMNEVYFPIKIHANYFSYGINMSYQFKVASNKKEYLNKTDYKLVNDTMIFNKKSNRNLIKSVFYYQDRIGIQYERILLKRQAFAIGAATEIGFFEGVFYNEISNHYIFGKRKHKVDLSAHTVFNFDEDIPLIFYPAVSYRFHSPLFFSFGLAPQFAYQKNTFKYRNSFIYHGVRPFINFGFMF